MKGSGRNGGAEKLQRIEKNVEMDFKTRKKLITGRRECSARVGSYRGGNCSGVVCSEQRILDLSVESS